MKLRMLPYVLSGPREKLQGIFKLEQDALCEEGSEALTNALAILKQYPALAVEYFDATDEEEHVSFTFMPISIFIASGASLQVIETVYNLYPEAVSTPHPKLGIYVS